MIKILIIGFFTFSGWSALSTYIYVCKIKGLCEETATMQIGAFKNNDTISDKALDQYLIEEQEVIPENLVIFFAFDKSDFNSNSISDNYFNKTNAYLNQNTEAKLSITGYTDAIGTDEYNQALGYRRARSLQYYFENKGIQAGKIILESKGEKEPADNNNTASGRKNNRRTAVTIKK